MTSRIHRFRELTVTHSIRSLVGAAEPAGGIFEDSDGSWYLRHDAMLSKGGILHSKGGTTSPEGGNVLFRGRRVIRRGRQGTFSGRHAAFEGWHYAFGVQHSTL